LGGKTYWQTTAKGGFLAGKGSLKKGSVNGSSEDTRNDRRDHCRGRQTECKGVRIREVKSPKEQKVEGKLGC